jgi:hypothetical protein
MIHAPATNVIQYVYQIDLLGFTPYLKPLGWGIVPLITQKYEGDRTIVPPNHWRDIQRLLVNPDEESLREFVSVGERATWPHYTWLKTALMIEIALDDSIKQLRQTLRVRMTQHSLYFKSHANNPLLYHYPHPPTTRFSSGCSFEAWCLRE